MVKRADVPQMEAEPSAVSMHTFFSQMRRFLLITASSVPKWNQ